MTPRHRRRSGSFLIMIAVLVGLVAASFAVYATVTGSGQTTEHAAPEPRRTPSPSPTTPSSTPRPKRTSSPTPSPTPTRTKPDAVSGVAPKPPIVSKPIPFGAVRKQETTAYAKRHYGLDTWRLEDPHVIVEHYTAGTSFQSAYNTFAANSPDLGELPGTCAHFIIDSDGTIYQVAPLTVMCRHTVGLNYTAIGIEHVGTSDQQVLRDKAQLDASLHLTLWLMQRYGISLPNVIGHNESLSSPYHHELVASWRCQTHSDWTHPDMETYRRLLANAATNEGAQISHRVTRGRSDATSC
jgi:N-acetylmuramoyl-L-alanine amidase